MGHDQEADKQNAVAFYRTAYLGDSSKAVENYVGEEYVRHKQGRVDNRFTLSQAEQFSVAENA